MWFKNARLYRFTSEFLLTQEKLAAHLGAHPFTEMTALQESTFGWVPPFNDSEWYCDEVAGRLFFTAQLQEKILPSGVLNEELLKRVNAIEATEGRRPGAKERSVLKEEIRAELLPRAFHKTRRISAWIDSKRGWLVVNCASEKQSDHFTAMLREAIGSLPVVPQSKQASHGLLTTWFSEPTLRPEGLEIAEDLRLVMPEDPTVKATYKNLDLEAPEVQHSIDSGMRIVKMGVALAEDGTCTIDKEQTLTRITYADQLIEQTADDPDPRTDTLLMSDTLTKWIEHWADIKE